MKLVTAALFALVSPLSAQGGTDIWLVPLTGTMRAPGVGTAANVTNRPGYDNQPSFSPDGGTMYYTSQRDGQTDIYKYSVAGGAVTQVTKTPESEYSAQLMPDGKGISVIRVERDSTQRLWSFTLDGTAIGPVLESIKPVGYHAWLDAETVFVYVLGSAGTPATLQRASVKSGTATIVATRIGRTILRSTQGTVIYYAQRDTSGWWVHALDGTRDQAIAKLPSPRDDFFAVTAEGDLIAASGNRLLIYQRAEEKWIELAKFSEPGLQHITRIAVSPAGDYLAVVGDEPAPPTP
jgi:dipeptidyl aminopeptidase/acylaminoacyl peptidase